MQMIRGPARKRKKTSLEAVTESVTGVWVGTDATFSYLPREFSKLGVAGAAAQKRCGDATRGERNAQSAKHPNCCETQLFRQRSMGIALFCIPERWWRQLLDYW